MGNLTAHTGQSCMYADIHAERETLSSFLRSLYAAISTGELVNTCLIKLCSSYLTSVLICLTGNHKSICYCCERHSDTHVSCVGTHSKGDYLWINRHAIFLSWILKGSDDDVWHSGLLFFFTSSIVRYPNEHNVSETGSVSVLRWGGGRHLLCWVR
jgi:hypothetical protein